MPVDYDQLAEQYKKYRKPDPKIAARIQFHIQGAQRVLNVGAGMGSYEPEDCEVVAIEPSYEMIAKRKRAKATLIQGFAEDLPFIDNGFDISMGILTIHHWSDIALGLQEMLRVSKNKIVLFTWIGYGSDFCLQEYIPEIKRDALDTGLDTASIDKVLLFGVIPFPLLPLNRLLPEMHRVLKPEGTLAVWLFPPMVHFWVPQSILHSGLFTYIHKRNGVYNYRR